MAMGIWKHFVHNARWTIVIINQQYTKGEIHLINDIVIVFFQLFESSHLYNFIDYKDILTAFPPSLPILS